MNKSLAALAAGAAGLLTAGLVALAAPASATTTEPAPVCATWKARGATGAYPNVDFGGKPAGTEISASSVKLVKPTEGTDPGVEFAAKDLEVGPLENEAYVFVSYVTADGASVSAGAVRMFGYDTKDADTLMDAPTWQAVADAESGNLVFTVPAGKKIGTLGLVYDASNNTAGSVTFTGLKIGDRPVRFTPCATATPTATATATATPTATTTVTPTSTGSARPTTSAIADAGAAGPSLPVTGPSMGLLIAGGLGIIAAGLALTLVARRRKTDFKA